MSTSILLGGICGAIAGLLAALLVRRQPAAKKYQALIFVAFFAVLYGVGKGSLAIGRRSGGTRAEAEAYFDSSTLFRLLADADTGLRAEFVDFTVRLQRQGVTSQEVYARAIEWGRQRLTPVVMKYAPYSSDSAVLQFAAAFADVIASLRTDDPDACVTFMFGTVAGRTPAAPRLSPRQERAISDALVALLKTAKDAPTAPPDSSASVVLVQVLRSRITADYGEAALADVAALTDPGHSPPAQICAGAYDVYSTALHLPPEQGASLMRYLFANAGN